MNGVATIPSRVRSTASFWMVLAIVALLQLSWFVWIMGQPLPNAANSGGLLTRSYLLWYTFPGVVPGVTWRGSYLGNVFAQLSHFENLRQRTPIILAASYLLLAALALGRLSIRAVGLAETLAPHERLALAFGLGMSGLGAITLILGRLGVLNPWSVRIGLLAPIVVETWRVVKDRSRAKGGDVPKLPQAATLPLWSVPTLLLLVAPFLVVMALGAMLPTIDFDSIEYHLQGPKEYFQNGKITYLPHNVYTSMPFAVEMLHLLGMELLDDWWSGALVGQLLIASFAPFAGLMIWSTALRWGSSRAAWVATAVYLSTPWIYRMAAIPYVEGPLCYYHAALLWSVGCAWSASDDSRRLRLWVVSGCLAGGAMAIKYPGLVSAVAPFGIVAIVAAWKSRSSRIVLAYGLGVALVMAPWLIKNAIDTGNPVYPLGYKVFGSATWDAQLDAKWSKAHGPRPISAKAWVESFLEVTGRSDWQSPLYTALVPLAALNFARRRTALLLAAFVVYLFATWWFLTHRLDRFWLPLLPPLAILAGLGADWTRHRAWSILLGMVLMFGFVANFIYDSTPLAGLNDWTGDYQVLRRSVPRMYNLPLAVLDAQLPPDAKPLLVAEAAVFHLNHRVIYNTVFNKETIEELSKGKSVEQIREALQGSGVTHVYVNWAEAARYRSPGNYGFTDYVTPERFKGWVDAGLFLPPEPIGRGQDLYMIRPLP